MCRKLLFALPLALGLIAAPASARLDQQLKVRWVNTIYSGQAGVKNPYAGWHDADVSFVTGTELKRLASFDARIGQVMPWITPNKRYALVTMPAANGSPKTSVTEITWAGSPCNYTFDIHCLSTAPKTLQAYDYHDHTFEICVSGQNC